MDKYKEIQAEIDNGNIQPMKCPICGELMIPISIVDRTEYGLEIQYECPECLTDIVA